jgi:hypothetical protein
VHLFTMTLSSPRMDCSHNTWSPQRRWERNIKIKGHLRNRHTRCASMDFICLSQNSAKTVDRSMTNTTKNEFLKEYPATADRDFK